MKIFIDSNIFISLVNRTDPNHKKALYLFNEIEKNKDDVTTSNYVISEVTTILSQRFSHNMAIKFGNDLYSGDTIILTTDKYIENLTWDIFKKNINKDISYVDCSNIAFCTKHKISKMITFDKNLTNLYKEYS